MKNKAIVLVMFSFCMQLSSCASSSWQANPLGNKRLNVCKPSELTDLQMIFIPGYGESVVLVEDCDFYRAEKVSIALQAFELAWISRFGKSSIVSENLRRLVITFGFDQKMRRGYTADGRFSVNGIIEGMTLSENSIWVKTHPGELRICNTSLSHELVHASLWALNGHGDPDHLGTKFRGWADDHFVLIDQVNKYLCILGI